MVKAKNKNKNNMYQQLGALAHDIRLCTRKSTETDTSPTSIIIVKVTQIAEKARILKECYKKQNACYI